MIKKSITIPDEYFDRLVRLQSAKSVSEGRAVSFTEIMIETSMNGIDLSEEDLGIGLSFPRSPMSEKMKLAHGVRQVFQKVIAELIP